MWRERGRVMVLARHHVEIKLGASYPRTLPEIRWVTPIYHPNISEIGMVCLGGYGTHWVPSIQLDELCVMLWDMLRYHNYDIRSPYNRDAALWTASQTMFRFPIDERPLRDIRATQAREAVEPQKSERPSESFRAMLTRVRQTAASARTTPVSRVLQFIERYGRPAPDSTTSAARRQAAEPPAASRASADSGRNRPFVDSAAVRTTPSDATAPHEQTAPAAADSLRPERVAEPEPMPAPQVTSATDLESRQTAAPSDQNDIFILEDCPDPAPARVDAGRSGGNDDVIFIS